MTSFQFRLTTDWWRATSISFVKLFLITQFTYNTFHSYGPQIAYVIKKLVCTLWVVYTALFVHSCFMWFYCCCFLSQQTYPANALFGNYQWVSGSIEISAKCIYFTVMRFGANKLFFKTKFVYSLWMLNLLLHAVFAFQNRFRSVQK